METRRFPFNKRLIWTTKEGKKIPVEQMQESHILNCMRMIGKKDELYKYFLYELAYRKGDKNTMFSIDPHIGSVIQIKHNSHTEFWDDYWERNTY